ncbi:MAG TPA: DUF2489 domain-containing protein [Polyangia bacterium]|nr:DUF2489 domain-containing protein [Polyangia bacterium]
MLGRRSALPSETEIQAARAEVVNLARRVLSGDLSILLAARELSRLRFSVGGDEWDPDFIQFVAIDSETDHLPVGQARQHWASEALVEKDEEIARAEAWARDGGLTACQRLLDRFG